MVWWILLLGNRSYVWKVSLFWISTGQTSAQFWGILLFKSVFHTTSELLDIHKSWSQTASVVRYCQLSLLDNVNCWCLHQTVSTVCISVRNAKCMWQTMSNISVCISVNWLCQSMSTVSVSVRRCKLPVSDSINCQCLCQCLCQTMQTVCVRQCQLSLSVSNSNYLCMLMSTISVSVKRCQLLVSVKINC